MYMGSDHFWGVNNSEFQYYFWVFRKLNIFGVLTFCGYNIGLIIKFDYIKGSFLCILRSMYRMGAILGLPKFQISFGVLEIPDFL